MINAEGYKTVKGKLTLKKGMKEKSIKLTPQAKKSPAQLTLVFQPSEEIPSIPLGAVIEVFGPTQLQRSLSGGDPLKLTLPQGSYFVQLSVEGQQRWASRITLTDGEMRELQMQLISPALTRKKSKEIKAVI